MKGRWCNLFILWMATCLSAGWAQRSPFSLQAAVDELHRQEYPLNAPPGSQQSHYLAGAFGSSPDQDYWDEEAAYTLNTKKHRNRLNKQLAKYLERENYDADHGGLGLGPFGGYEFDEDNNRLAMPQYSDERKRSSIFRERGNIYDDGPQSIFREREIPDASDHSELTDQFLHEIEQNEEHKKEQYKMALRNLWEKYLQQEENELDNGNIYEEQKKRMRMPPYYMLMQKKRSYPVLPWLPYSVDRKKRFPVAKRSAPHVANELPASGMGKTDENVERELSELFGSGVDEKKKRSIDDKHNKVATTHEPEGGAGSDMHLEEQQNTTQGEEIKSSSGSEDHHMHAGHSMSEHKHGKRSNHNTSHESREEEGEEEDEDSDEERESEEDEEAHDHEHDHDHDHDHNHDHEHDHEGEGENAKRKKKRDASAAKRKRNVAALRRTMDDLTKMRSKKSIDWSNYFGLDRKKKALPLEEANKAVDMKKRDAEEDTGSPVEDLDKKKKRNFDPAKLDSMNKKLKAIEDYIIHDSIKYTGAHQGTADPIEIQRIKDHVLSRLATAYSLEKMRRALDKLRQSVESENHIMHNIIEPDASDSSENTSLEAAKKDSPPKSSQPPVSEEKTNEEMKRKIKKSNGFMRYPEVPNEFGDLEETIQSPNRYESLNDAYLGNKNYILGTNQCPIIESMAQRCRGVDMLSGDLNQELLPLCGVHQLCYLCGTSQISCDYQYLAEADALCGPSNECQATARSVLMILRGSPGPQLGPRECVKNSCLYSAMREIGL